MGCDIVKVYKDHGISGAKGREKRPAFDALCRDAAQRKFDLVMAWSVDRLGRSLQDLVALLSELQALRIDLFLHQQGLDTTTPAGKAMFQMMGVFAEFERAMIQERVSPVQTALRNCTKDEGRPFEVGNQVLISSHRKLLLSKAMVVNVAEKSGQDSGRQG
jgi:DNA invertase Pin-like site-specific DNA recombinase